MNKKGFTLIEVLIVVVIIAVLAALILPRFLGQTERAVIAEAQQMLGAMRRGQQNYMDMAGTTTGITVATAGATATGTTGWAQIGMSPPTASTTWGYACTSAGVCTAARAATAAAPYNGDTISLNYLTTGGVASGNFTCGGDYAYLNDADRQRGCTA